MALTPLLRRLRLRFSLRTLLVFISIVAIVCWSYWSGWPRFQTFCQQSQLEREALQLKVGMNNNDLSRLVTWRRGKRGQGGRTINREMTSMWCFPWPNALYCFHFVHEPWQDGVTMWDVPYKSVELFRLPPAPVNYERNKGYKSLEESSYTDSSNLYEYLKDFEDVLCGDRSDSRGFQYELIYSDPPRVTNSN